jgi:hypothetical protein
MTIGQLKQRIADLQAESELTDDDDVWIDDDSGDLYGIASLNEGEEGNLVISAGDPIE